MTTRPQLRPEIVEALQCQNPSAPYPEGLFGGIMTAATLLHKKELPLADQPLPETPHEKTVERILRHIINDSLCPQLETKEFSSRKNGMYEPVCQLSDIYFGKAINALRDRTVRDGRGMRIVVRDDEPLLLQKSEGALTALSLQPLNVEGIRYPAGSIMSVHIAHDYRRETRAYEPHFPDGEVEITSATKVRGLDFLRPSLFALPPKEREISPGSENWWWYTATFPKSIETLTRMSVQRVGEIVARSVARAQNKVPQKSTLPAKLRCSRPRL